MTDRLRFEESGKTCELAGSNTFDDCLPACRCKAIPKQYISKMSTTTIWRGAPSDFGFLHAESRCRLVAVSNIVQCREFEL